MLHWIRPLLPSPVCSFFEKKHRETVSGVSRLKNMIFIGQVNTEKDKCMSSEFECQERSKWSRNEYKELRNTSYYGGNCEAGTWKRTQVGLTKKSGKINRFRLLNVFYICRKKLPVPMFSRNDFSIWSVLKNCIGKELSKITMPVIFNEPLSFLQRMVEYMEYADLLRIASEQTDPVDRMKVCVKMKCYWKNFKD